MPSTTRSASNVPSLVTTARTRPSESVSIASRWTDVRTSMPMPSIAACTNRPMSASRVAIGSGERVTTVTVRPRLTIASAISMPM